MQQEYNLNLEKQTIRYAYEMLSDRQVEIAIAQKIGYSVCPYKDQDIYILIRPLGCSEMPGGGLYTIRGTGPKIKVDSPFRFISAYNSEDAWEWVPHFCSNDIHYSTLLRYIHYRYDLPMVSGCASRRQSLEHYLQYFDEQQQGRVLKVKPRRGVEIEYYVTYDFSFTERRSLTHLDLNKENHYD